MTNCYEDSRDIIWKKKHVNILFTRRNDKALFLSYDWASYKPIRRDSESKV